MNNRLHGVPCPKCDKDNNISCAKQGLLFCNSCMYYFDDVRYPVIQLIEKVKELIKQ